MTKLLTVTRSVCESVHCFGYECGTHGDGVILEVDYYAEDYLSNGYT